jgi:prepilin-type N-terminal cleavage/methylation domain-containing protein
MSGEAQREMKHLQIPGFSPYAFLKAKVFPTKGRSKLEVSDMPSLRHCGSALGPQSSSFYTLGSKELDSGLTAGMTGGRYSQTMGFVLRRLRAVFHTKPRSRQSRAAGPSPPFAFASSRLRVQKVPACASSPESKGAKGGFTLVEMIVSLVLLGILAAVVMSGIVQAVNGFVFVTGTQGVVEGAELAMLRLSKELTVTSKSTLSGNSSSLTFSSLHTGTPVTYTAALSNSRLLLRDSAGNSYVLANNVEALGFSYYNAYSGPPVASWSSSSRIVGISITVVGPGSALVTFSTRVAPRN